MSRGDRREDIFYDDDDHDFLKTLTEAQACATESPIFDWPSAVEFMRLLEVTHAHQLRSQCEGLTSPTPFF